MRPILLESDRSLLRSAECTFASVLAHAALVGLALALTAGGPRIPVDEREARVFFLLPPDRADVELRQTERFQWSRPGMDLQDGKDLVRPGEGWRLREQTYGARAGRGGSGARGQLAFGPVPKLRLDTAFSVLEVDRTVERFESSAAPVYPPDLLALGAEGSVHATYVVDTAGSVDTSTIRVLGSDDARFTESVLTALRGMRFRPARRRGAVVRQLVEQHFHFRMGRPAQGVSARGDGTSVL